MNFLKKMALILITALGILACPDKGGVAIASEPKAEVVVDGGSPDAGSKIDISKFKIKGGDGQEAYLALALDDPKRPVMIFMGSIFPESASEFNRNLIAMGSDPFVKEILIVLDSPGGNVASAQMMVAIMQSVGQNKAMACAVTSNAMSSGFFVLEAGCPKRLAMKPAVFLMHLPVTTIRGVFTSADLELLLKDKLEVDEKFLGPVAKRLKITSKELRERIGTTQWTMDSEDALKNKAIDCIFTRLGNIDKDCPKSFVKWPQPSANPVPEDLLQGE